MAESEARKQSLVTQDSLSLSFIAGLLEYVKTNNVEQLKLLLDISLIEDKKSRLNSKYEFTSEERSTHASPVFIASALGHVEVLKLLLAHDADPNLPAEDKRSPLMVASSSNHPEVVDLLLSKGADITAQDADGDTCLRYANDRNNPHVVKILLDAKANPNIKGENDWTCLLIACADDYPNIVTLLLEYGADPYHVEKGGKTCLMLASYSGHIEVLEILLKSKSIQLQRLINVQSKGGWTALALAYDQPKAVELLLKYGADANIATNQRWTPLMLACQSKGCPETVELLLKYKADPNAKRQLGMTAYTLARWNDNKRLMEMLEKAGAKKTSILQNAFSSFFTSLPALNKQQPIAQNTKQIHSQSVEECPAMSLEAIRCEKESLDRERKELMLAEKRNKKRMAELTVEEVKVRKMMEKGPQSSNKEGGDSKSLATPTATVSDYNAEEEMIHSLGVVQGVVTVLPQPKANEDRLMLELETAKKERREEIIKLESSRKANEARIAVLESSQQQQENRVAEFEKELHTLRQDWVREIENIKRKSSIPASSSRSQSSQLSLDNPPKDKDLLDKVASRAQDKWKLVGVQLEIGSDQLNTIQNQNLNPIVCYSEVFRLWRRKGHPPVTWATIIDALRAPSVQEDALAGEIEKNLK